MFISKMSGPRWQPPFRPAAQAISGPFARACTPRSETATSTSPRSSGRSKRLAIRAGTCSSRIRRCTANRMLVQVRYWTSGAASISSPQRSESEMARTDLGVAVIGFGWMGHVHTRAYSRVLQHYPELSVAPRLLLVADPEPGRLTDAVDRYGFAGT